MVMPFPIHVTVKWGGYEYMRSDLQLAVLPPTGTLLRLPLDEGTLCVECQEVGLGFGDDPRPWIIGSVVGQRPPGAPIAQTLLQIGFMRSEA